MSQTRQQPRQPVAGGAGASTGSGPPDMRSSGREQPSGELSDADLGEVVGGYEFIDTVE